MALSDFKAALCDLKSFNVTFRIVINTTVNKNNDATVLVENSAITTDLSPQNSLRWIINQCEIAVTILNSPSSTSVVGTYELCLILLVENSQLVTTESTSGKDDIHTLNLSKPLFVKYWTLQALGLLLLKEILQKEMKMEEIVEQEKGRYDFKSSYIIHIRNLLEHSEPRVRKMCSEVLYLIACNERKNYELFMNKSNRKCTEIPTSLSISHNASNKEGKASLHFSTYHSIGIPLLLKVKEGLHRVATCRPTTLGDDAFIALDDTTGWNTLESSIVAFHELVKGYGSIFGVVLEEREEIKIRKQKNNFKLEEDFKSKRSLFIDSAKRTGEDLNEENDQEFFSMNNGGETDGVFSCLITEASAHINRHVRESVYSFIRILCDPFTRSEDRVENLSRVKGVRDTYLSSSNSGVDKVIYAEASSAIVTALGIGLEENWSQIRRSALIAVKSFLLSSLSGPVTEGKRRKESFIWPVLLPRICINRFYVADGVKGVALQIWREMINKEGGVGGKELVSLYIDDMVTHYINMAYATNHMVSEAALLGIGELLHRVERKVMLPDINRIIECLVGCIEVDSWPIKDAATVATGTLVRYYPSETEHLNKLLVILNSWSQSLKEPIWSVRENAAVAFGQALQTEDGKVKQGILSVIFKHIQENLLSAEKEGVVGVKVITFIPPSMLKLMNKNSATDNPNNSNSSIITGDVAVNIKGNIRRQKGGWGCCLDCMDVRKGFPWEASDGCIYLIREICLYAPSEVEAYLEKVYTLLGLEHYKDYTKLHTTILAQLPVIFKLLNTPVSTDSAQRSGVSTIECSTQTGIIAPTTLPLSNVPQYLSNTSPVLSVEVRTTEPKININCSTVDSTSESVVVKPLSLGVARRKAEGNSGSRTKGTVAAKNFVENHAALIHRALSVQNSPTLVSIAHDLVQAISLHIGPSVFRLKLPIEFRDSFELLLLPLPGQNTLSER